MRLGLVVAIGAASLALAGPSFAQDKAQRSEAFAKLPYWSGYWVGEGQAGTTIGGIAPASIEMRETGKAPAVPVMTLSGFGAPWNDEGKARMAERMRIAPGRKAMGWGYPMMMDSAAPLQFLITPEETLIISPYGDVRHIYTDGRAMPAAEDLWPTVWGTSIGHWEGDTLVIETKAVKNPNIYFHTAPPLSEEAHYLERIRMDGDRLVSEVTIEDPTTLTGPWKSRLTYVRDEGFDRMIQIDFDNDRTGFDGQINTIEPAHPEGQH
ncbi:hypothetical protein [Altererythrobacter sp. Root672]|uniref:hypothetical protein n=1 Tax=Altererythrobacter sp. Root672 TaxID=1736584 RepID=UPI0006FBFCC8|nr:hypothetical protein [Altererythrobacter sp. Root672]KRA81355.1 hypothetical protein ASD76_12370 [Altererythrobacter sp. Root672]